MDSSRLQQVLAQLDETRRKYQGYVGQRAALEQMLVAYEAELEDVKSLDLSYQKLQKFFTSMGTVEQERLQKWFEQVVTYGFTSVFGESSYRFVITGPEVKQSEIAIGFELVQRIGDTDYPRDPYTEMGGGICDVLSFLLQFLMVFLLRDRVNPILLLDEPFKHLSVEFRPAVASLLRELVNKTPVQIIMVSHEPLFLAAADVAYNFSQPNMETVVERIDSA